MFHFISRVVVVSVVALSLNFVVVPAAQAKVQVPRTAVSNADKSCMDQAMELLNRVLGNKARKSPKKKVTSNDGCGIDPFGNPRPCG